MFFRNKILSVVLVLALASVTTNYACNAGTWVKAIETYLPQILQIVAAIAPMVGALYATADPADAASAQSIAAEAVKDAQVLQKAYAYYQGEPNATNRQAVQAALETIETNLPALMQAAHIKNAKLLASVTAAVNLTVSLADTIMAAMPDKAPAIVTARARVSKTSQVLGKPLTTGEAKWYWDSEVCGNNAACANLVH